MYYRDMVHHVIDIYEAIDYATKITDGCYMIENSYIVPENQVLL